MDYQKLGFKCGLEIHQQLETDKLFCSCPSIVRDTDPNIHFERQLRAVVGETGEIDAAASHEQKKQKKFIYDACSTSTCLVEMDEEPPHEINCEALKTVLLACKLFKAKIVDEVQVMRKTVIDGSNVSGFQRTALVGYDGKIDTPSGIVGITNICLEEESAKKVSEGKDHVNYRLDRLGIPLIEVGTDATIRSPEHAKEVAQKIGMILRSTGRVKRGLGTIRQDVNISIKGGARTEIKGFQDLKSIPKVIEYEIKRQLTGKKVQEVRKAEPDFTTSFLRPMPGAARMYPETDVLPVIITKEMLEIKDVELIDERIERTAKRYKIGKSTVQELEKVGIDIASLLGRFKSIEPGTMVAIRLDIPKDLKARENIDISRIKEEDYDEIFGMIDDRKMDYNRDTIRAILMLKANGKKVDYGSFKQVDNKTLEKEIIDIIRKNKDASFGAVMGQVMAKYRGKVDGRGASELIKQLMQRNL